MFEEIWLDIQTRVGTPHKMQGKNLVDGWVVGGLHSCTGYALEGYNALTGRVILDTGIIGMVLIALAHNSSKSNVPLELGWQDYEELD